jgi:hypothetical protein
MDILASLVDATYYRPAALVLASAIMLVDMLYFYGVYWTRGVCWTRAWTHWSYLMTMLYFGLGSLESWGIWQHRDTAGILYVIRMVAFGCTMSVNVGYWFMLLPLRVRKGEIRSFRDLSPPSIAKHGGSLLWLLGDVYVTTCGTAATNAPLFDLSMIRNFWGVSLLLFAPTTYVVFSIIRHRHTGDWVYGTFFSWNVVRFVFIVSPTLWCFLSSISSAYVARLLHVSCNSDGTSAWQWFPSAMLLLNPLHFAIEFLVISRFDRRGAGKLE